MQSLRYYGLPLPHTLRNLTIIFFLFFLFFVFFNFLKIFFLFFSFFAKLTLSLSCHKITSENTTSLQKKVTNDTDSQENTFLWSLQTPVTGTQVVAHLGKGEGEIASGDRGEIPALIWGKSQLALGRYGVNTGQAGTWTVAPSNPVRTPVSYPGARRAGAVLQTLAGVGRKNVFP